MIPNMSGAEVPNARVVDARREKQLEPEEGSESDKPASAASTGVDHARFVEPGELVAALPSARNNGHCSQRSC